MIKMTFGVDAELGPDQANSFQQRSSSTTHKPFDADDHNIRMFNSRGVPTRTAGQALTPRRESVSDDPEVDGFWKRCLAAHPTSNDEVEVRHVVAQYDREFGPASALDKRCLVAILAQGQKEGDGASLKKSDFVLFLSRFGPLKLCVGKVRSVLAEGRLWFHGNGDRDQCLRLLDNMPSNDKAFLVRYSTRSPGAFSIHYVKGGQSRIFNGITNNTKGEGINVASDDQSLSYSTFASFISKNPHLFAHPCPGPATDSFQRLKEDIAIQIAQEASGNVYCISESFVAEDEPEEEPDTVEGKVKAALDRCQQSGNHTAALSGLGLAAFPEAESARWLKLNDTLDTYWVDLSENNLSILPAKISNLLASASLLNVAHNHLSKLPPTFSLMRNLRALDLSHNKFTDIPTELYRLKQLEELRMTNNYLIYIPNVFFEEMAGLHVLDLSGNKIVELPANVSRSSSLSVLRVGSNQLRWLPRELARSPALEVLDIHNNHIHHLPRVLVNLFEKLKELNVTDNELDLPFEVTSGSADRIINWMKHQDQSDDEEDEGDLETDMGYDDDDEPEYEDLLEPPPENAPSNYAEPPELPPFKKNKKKAKRSRWERYQNQPLHNYCVVDKEAIRSSGRSSSRGHFLGRESRERRPTLTASSIVTLPNSEFKIEAGDSQAPFSAATFSIDSQNDCVEYSKYFITKVHTNFVGVDPVVGALTITISKEKDTPHSQLDASGEVYRALVRTTDEDKLWDIPASLLKLRKKVAVSKDLLKALLKVTKPHLSNAKMRVVRQKNAQAQFLKLDNVLRMPQHFRFGVLYAKDGQTSEQEFYDNPVGSPAFKHFLDFLGDRIRLKGWRRHRAGLDVKTDSTGTESYFTTFENFEVMFHVSTLLPLLPNDPSRLERKRHIGNDVVVIIFKDTQPGKPSSPLPIQFASHMTHVYVVVEIDHARSTDEQVVYRVNIASKDDVPDSEPHLPSPPVFEESDLFRTLLLTKLINAERASYLAAELKMANKRKRKAILEDLEKEVFPKTLKKRDEDKTKSYYLPIPVDEWKNT